MDLWVMRMDDGSIEWSTLVAHEDFHSGEIEKLNLEIRELETQIERHRAQLKVYLSIKIGACGVVRKRNTELSSSSNQQNVKSSKNVRSIVNKLELLLNTSNQSENEPYSHIQSIGTAFTQFRKRYEAPRQSFQAHAALSHARIQLKSTQSFLLNSSSQLRSGSLLWIVYWLDRNLEWRALVKPPRKKNSRVGVFATRSPNRPTPLGLSLVQVQSWNQETNELFLIGSDLLDETPVLELISYEKSLHFFPNECNGWIENRSEIQPLYYDQQDVNECDETRWKLEIGSGKVKEKLDFVNQYSVTNLFSAFENLLKCRNDPWTIGKPFDPKQFEYRAQVKMDFGENESGNLRFYPIGSFRIVFYVLNSSFTVSIVEIFSGLRQDVLISDYKVDPEIQLHAEYLKQFFPELHHQIFSE